MTPSRYLPCDLHPALSPPLWWVGGYGGPLTLGPKAAWFIDLAHPAGWDHAVRAYAAIRGVPVEESESVALSVYAADPLVAQLETSCGAHHAWSGELSSAEDSPDGRREALTRALYAALNVKLEGG